MQLKPKKIYYEPNVLSYDLGKYLKKKYSNLEWVPIENHNNIPMFRNNPNSEFARMKQNIIVGTRKTHKYVPNYKVSDYLVPYTSSGCSASCLYCYLVCNYNKCSYLRLFVNREQMLEKIIKTSIKSEQDLTFEIGSNSDLVLENTITNNLPWTIENFAIKGKGHLTFPTKFDMVDPILNINHNRKVIVRMSVNPEEIIRKVELGTSPLSKRIEAINKLCEANYKVGILIAPVIILPNWKKLYVELLETLSSELSKKVKKEMLIEVIFMTYSYVHRMINKEAFVNAVDLYNKDFMTNRGIGKYCYKKLIKDEASKFLRFEILKYFPKAKIVYII